ANIYPPVLRKKFRETLSYTGLLIDNNVLLSSMFLNILVLSMILSVVNLILSNIPWAISTFIISFVVLHILLYLIISLQADKKALAIEKVLPDALTSIASNLKAGLPLDKAIVASSKPELGILKSELDSVAKEVSLGSRIETSLTRLTDRIRSAKLKWSIELCLYSLKSGGQLSELLISIGNNLRNQEIIEDKIRSQILMYVFLIFGAVAIGVPFLNGMAPVFLDKISTITSEIDLESFEGTQMPISFGQVSVTTQFLVVHNLVAVIISVILGALLIGVVTRGKAKYGLKNIPILMTVALAVFFLVRKFITGFLASFAGI
ncbi:unnamed protein product, partial [marine sediment metagenome]